MSDNETESLRFNMNSEFDDDFENPFDSLRLPSVEELLQMNSNYISNEINFRQKRGRKPANNIIRKPHDKYSEDNIIRKIQVSYFNFIRDFINELLKSIGRQDLSFIPLDYNYKRTINKKFRNNLNSTTIKEVFNNNKISPKYSTKKININRNICEQIEKENQNFFENILNKNFLFFFDKIYYKNNKKINMEEFGFDNLEIDLENIELFGDLLSQEKNDKDLKEKMNFCAKLYFLPKKKHEIFQCIYY